MGFDQLSVLGISFPTVEIALVGRSTASLLAGAHKRWGEGQCFAKD